MMGMGTPNRRRWSRSSAWGAHWAASRGSGVIGIGVIRLFVMFITGLAGEQGYDRGFLCKLEHCAFGEDVILTGDSGKVEMVEGGGVCVCGPSCSRSESELLGCCCCCPLILGEVGGRRGKSMAGQTSWSVCVGTVGPTAAKGFASGACVGELLETW